MPVDDDDDDDFFRGFYESWKIAETHNEKNKLCVTKFEGSFVVPLFC